jgi:opacity protein-like surface antigen
MIRAGMIRREMIRFATTAIILTALIGSSAFAQDSTPKVQVFGGYSLVREDTGGLSLITVDLVVPHSMGTFGVNYNFKGWNAEGQYNANRWVGIAVDFGGRYGMPIDSSTSGVSGLPNSTGYSVMAGPVVSYRNKSKLTPFVHALFGWDRTSLSASTLTGVSPSASYPAITCNDFAFALGGGLDFKVLRQFSVRLGQVDYFHTSLNSNQLYGKDFDTVLFEGFPTHQVNFRFSAGIVAQF